MRVDKLIIRTPSLVSVTAMVTKSFVFPIDSASSTARPKAENPS